MTQIVTKIGQVLITQIYFSIQQTGLTHSRYPSIGTFKTWQNSKLWIVSAAMLEVLHAGLHNARLRVFPPPVPGYWRHEAGARRLQPRQHHHHRLRGHHPRPDRGGPEDLPLPPVLWPDPLPDLRLRSLLAVQAVRGWHTANSCDLKIINVKFKSQNVAKAKYGFSSSDSPTGPESKNNLLQVNVYYDSLSEEQVSSNIVYEVMWSDIHNPR